MFLLWPPVRMDDAGGAARWIDFGAPPAGSGPGVIRPGSTWNSQFWYRDPLGPGGMGFNLSDAVSVGFCP
ncbi:MAG: hypothetical protein QGI46_08820 [Planctomycetota bacterium]|nr:hypothetical protein [Planctomycetota bacterium]